MALFKFIAVALIISACFLGGESHQSRSGILATDADTVLPAVSAAMALPPFAGDDGAAESDAVPDTSTSDYTGTSADASKSKDTSDDAPIDPRKWIPKRDPRRSIEDDLDDDGKCFKRDDPYVPGVKRNIPYNGKQYAHQCVSNDGKKVTAVCISEDACSAYGQSERSLVRKQMPFESGVVKNYNGAGELTCPGYAASGKDYCYEDERCNLENCNVRNKVSYGTTKNRDKTATCGEIFWLVTNCQCEIECAQVNCEWVPSTSGASKAKIVVSSLVLLSAGALFV